ncbi:MAG TPA: NAD(P)H-dependent oxidoreductase subunit E [Gemmatimonadaceae bacterium]|nr:NAD(P)H-dependent oxidoreductase subunit E [Gemmatimonadaceae bacterium]
MDLHFLDAEPTADERAAVDALLGAAASGWDGGTRDPVRDTHVAFGGHDARSRRHLLLPALHAVQSRVGWISEGALNYVCQRLTVPPADAWGVATFYALFSTTPRPRRVLHVCDDIACKCRGSDELIAVLENSVEPEHHAPRGDHVEVGAAAWVRSPCLGMCDRAPAALLQEFGAEPHDIALGNVTESVLGAAFGGGPSSAAAKGAAGPRARAKGSKRVAAENSYTAIFGTPDSAILLQRVGRVDPTSLDAYRASGGYAALRRALEIGRDRVIAEVTESKLMGRGGAAFPTGRKWDAVARQPAQPHYLICNADESEPGTFKDRVLMEQDPFALVEAMTIAAFATGCETGYLYIRGEYPLAVTRMRHAIEAARSANVLGENILGTGVHFDIEIRRGAGAYICGEETALFNSIEGLRGEPRNKPPFPVQAGLFGKPTVVNNVETLMNVPHIIAMGGAAYAKIGTAQSTGTRLFCVSGCVATPGLYEAPFGITARDLLEMAGGVRSGRRLQTVLLGGAAGVFIRPDELDMRLTFEDTRAAKATLGSGVFLVFDNSVDLGDVLRRIAAFFRDESCGQCVPCRVGTVRQEEALHRIAARKTRGGIDAEVALLDDVGAAMKDASICGLGQTAYSAIESAIHRLRVYDGATGASA